MNPMGKKVCFLKPKGRMIGERLEVLVNGEKVDTLSVQKNLGEKITHIRILYSENISPESIQKIKNTKNYLEEGIQFVTEKFQIIYQGKGLLGFLKQPRIEVRPYHQKV